MGWLVSTYNRYIKGQNCTIHNIFTCPQRLWFLHPYNEIWDMNQHQRSRNPIHQDVSAALWMQQVLRSKGKYINWDTVEFAFFFNGTYIWYRNIPSSSFGRHCSQGCYVFFASALTLFSVLDDFGGIWRSPVVPPEAYLGQSLDCQQKCLDKMSSITSVVQLVEFR